MNELAGSKQAEQLQELLDLLEQMQEEISRKDKSIEELQMQLTELLELNEKLNSENKAENVQVLKSELKQTSDLLLSERRKRSKANTIIGELQGKTASLAERVKQYEQTHQKVAAYEGAFIGFVAYSLLITIFIGIRAETFTSDFIGFFTAIWNGICLMAEWINFMGKYVAHMGDKIPQEVFGTIVYWLLRVIIMVVIAGALGFIIWMVASKLKSVYKKYCWDIISVIVTVISMAIVVYFGDWIKAIVPVNLMILLLLVQMVYVMVRWYVKGYGIARGYF